jgi:hypothetical protein
MCAAGGVGVAWGAVPPVFVGLCRALVQRLMAGIVTHSVVGWQCHTVGACWDQRGA